MKQYVLCINTNDEVGMYFKKNCTGRQKDPSLINVSRRTLLKP